MLELTKEMTLKEGLREALKKAHIQENSVLFSYSFRFEVRDLLPILTHPSDKNTIRVYWEQPSQGFAFAGLGSIIDLQDSEKVHSKQVYQKIKQTMDEAVSVSDHLLIGPRIVGGYAFNLYRAIVKTWDKFPRTKFLLPECMGTSTDDGSWLTISRMVKPGEEINLVENEFARTKIFYENRLPVTLPPILRSAVDKFRDVPDQNTYTQTIFSVLGKIKPSQLEKVVISRSHHVKVGKGFSCVSAMQVLRNVYPKCTSFFFSF